MFSDLQFGFKKKLWV